MIRRLLRAGVLKEARNGNRRYFKLNLNDTESECWRAFFSISDNLKLEERSIRFSRNAAARLRWMDQAFGFYHQTRSVKHDSP